MSNFILRTVIKAAAKKELKIKNPEKIRVAIDGIKNVVKMSAAYTDESGIKQRKTVRKDLKETQFHDLIKKRLDGAEGGIIEIDGRQVNAYIVRDGKKEFITDEEE